MDTGVLGNLLFRIFIGILPLNLIGQSLDYETDYRMDSLQYKGTLEKYKSKDASLSIELPLYIINKLTEERNLEANTTTLKFQDSISTFKDSVILDFTFVKWQSESTIETFFKADTATLINSYEGEILEFGELNLKNEKALFHLSTSPFENLNIYAFALYFRTKEHLFKCNTYFLSDQQYGLQELRFYLNYFHSSIASINIK